MENVGGFYAKQIKRNVIYWPIDGYSPDNNIFLALKILEIPFSVSLSNNCLRQALKNNNAKIERGKIAYSEKFGELDKYDNRAFHMRDFNHISRILQRTIKLTVFKDNGINSHIRYYKDYDNKVRPFHTCPLWIQICNLLK